jgi:hypothetical protein
LVIEPRAAILAGGFWQQFRACGETVTNIKIITVESGEVEREDREPLTAK